MRWEESRQPTEIGALKELVGGLQAIHVAMAEMERRATTVIWRADSGHYRYAMRCVMEAVAAFYEALSKCQPKSGGTSGGSVGTGTSSGGTGTGSGGTGSGSSGTGGGVGPDCGQGYHEEYDNCVKNPPGGG